MTRIHALAAAGLILLLIIAQASFARPQAEPTPSGWLPLIQKLPPTPTLTPTLPGPTSTPTQTPIIPTSTPTSLPPTFNGCQEDPNPAAAPNYPVRISSINKSAEVVTLQNVGAFSIDLTGWHVCSINGNQEHPNVAGTLAPGESRSFANSGGPIWNNIERDDGALYSSDGSLISYRVDQ